MAQHRKLTLAEVERWLDKHPEKKDKTADLLRTLVVVDQNLVKHDKTPLARQLRRAVATFMNGRDEG